MLNEVADSAYGSAALCTMRLAMGLKFRVVAVMACDDEVISSQERIEGCSGRVNLATY